MIFVLLFALLEKHLNNQLMSKKLKAAPNVSKSYLKY